MKRILMSAALAVAACAFAMPAPAQQRQTQIKLDLSPAGQVIAKKYLSTPNPQMQGMMTRAVDLTKRQKAVIDAPKFDLNQFTSLLRQREQLQTQMMKLSNDRLLQMLREFSEADRSAFVRGMANPQVIPAPATK